MDINTASLKDLEWYRGWLQVQLMPLLPSFEEAFSKLTFTEVNYTTWAERREYMKRQLAKVEARLAA